MAGSAGIAAFPLPPTHGSIVTSYTVYVQAPLIDYLDLTIRYGVGTSIFNVQHIVQSDGSTLATQLTAVSGLSLAVTVNTVVQDNTGTGGTGTARFTMQGRSASADASLPAVLRADPALAVATFNFLSNGSSQQYRFSLAAVAKYAGSTLPMDTVYLK